MVGRILMFRWSFGALKTTARKTLLCIRALDQEFDSEGGDDGSRGSTPEAAPACSSFLHSSAILQNTGFIDSRVYHYSLAYYNMV